MRGRVAALVLRLLAWGVLSQVPAASAGAQEIILRGAEPWRPTTADTLAIWGREAQALLESSREPVLGSKEYRAYELLGRIAAHYFSRLGTRGIAAAGGLHTVFDSLGIRIEIGQDEKYPEFVLVHFLHPLSDSYPTLAYLYWFRGEELLSQPFNLGTGRQPLLEVFWTGNPLGPYEAGLVYDSDTSLRSHPVFALLRLAADGSGWIPIQAGRDGLDLGGAGKARWVDIDLDGTPEVVSWTETETDSTLELCDRPGCPRLRVVRVFTRHPREGFLLTESRLVASPLATLAMFLRSVRRGDEVRARAMVTDSALVERARELGWERIHQKGGFRIGRNPERTSWVDRIRFEYRVPDRAPGFAEARFVNRNGVWLLSGIRVFTQNGPEGAPAAGAGRSGDGP